MRNYTVYDAFANPNLPKKNMAYALLDNPRCILAPASDSPVVLFNGVSGRSNQRLCDTDSLSSLLAAPIAFT